MKRSAKAIAVLPLRMSQWEKDNQEWGQIRREWERYKAANEASAFFKFAVKATQGKFKKSASSMLVDIAAKDLKQRAKRVRQARADGDAPWLLQRLGIIEKAEAMGDVGFFKSLGRALSKNHDEQAWGWGNLGWAMLKLMWQQRGISDQDAERELKKQNFKHATAENFNKTYNRVRVSLPPELQHLVPKRKPGRRKS